MGLTYPPFNKRPPSLQKFLSTGTTTGWLFVTAGVNATLGATYTNNSNTYTVQGTIAGQIYLFASNAAAPLSSGTLTKTSGTGDSTIAFSAAVVTALYTPPVGVYYLRVRGAGGGGGSGGSGSAGVGAGGTGNGTFFGANVVQALGGAGGNGPGSAAGAGGVITISAGPIGQGWNGGAGNNPGITAVAAAGAAGGSNMFGAAGAAGPGGGTAGVGPSVNTGGGGGGNGGAATYDPGSGGGAGACFDVIINAPLATYPYIIGTGGAAGGAGTSGAAGVAGAAGILIIEEFYQ